MSGPDNTTRVVLTTAPDPGAAASLARALVEERLAACANVLPGVRSVYWWEGEIEDAEEVLVVLKTTGDRLEAMLRRAAVLHPYDVPELLALPVDAGHPPYLDWVRRETRDDTSGP